MRQVPLWLLASENPTPTIIPLSLNYKGSQKSVDCKGVWENNSAFRASVYNLTLTLTLTGFAL